MDFKDGDTITVNGKPFRIEGSALVPVVKRGPLGGELKKWDEMIPGEKGYLHVQKGFESLDLKTFEGFKAAIEYCNIETNIPPRPTFTPMSAGEAAKLPDIVGRWVAVRVEAVEPECGYRQPIKALGQWIHDSDRIMLIEGADL